MENPKKEPTLPRQQQESKLCLNCGFPNRNTDTHCMYCQTSLIEDTGLISWFRQTYYILRWRWELKQRRDNLKPSSGKPILKSLGYFALGAGLSGTGLFLFTSAVSQNSFSNGLIATLFIIYGVFTLKNLFDKR